MRKIIGLSVFLAVSSALAQVSPEAVKTALSTQTDCGNFIRVADSKVIIGSGIYWPMGAPAREPIPSPLTIIDTAKNNLTTVVETSDSAVDVLSWNDRLFVLTYEGLEERSADGLTVIAVHPTVKDAPATEYRSHATRMVLHKDRLFISHGTKGVSVFDLNSRKVLQTIPLVAAQFPLESQATSVALSGDKVLILMDSFSSTSPRDVPPFRGIIVMNANTLAIEAELNGMDPGPDSLYVSGDDLLVSFMGFPIWKLKVSELKGNKIPKVRGSITKFGTPGHPWGLAWVDETYYHTCFNKHPATPEDEQVVTRVIRSIDRKANKL